MSNREIMEYDVVVVGAGPSGLSAAIKLKQLTKEANKDLSVCVIEKGSEVGAHIVSGAVIETKALYELIPDWKSKNSPLKIEAKDDKFLYIIKIADFYFQDSADLLIKRIKNDTPIKKINLERLSDTNYRVFLGPFDNLNSLKSSFNDISMLKFENLEIIKK